MPFFISMKQQMAMSNPENLNKAAYKCSSTYDIGAGEENTRHFYNIQFAEGRNNNPDILDLLRSRMLALRTHALYPCHMLALRTHELYPCHALVLGVHEQHLCRMLTRRRHALQHMKHKDRDGPAHEDAHIRTNLLHGAPGPNLSCGCRLFGHHCTKKMGNVEYFALAKAEKEVVVS